MTWYEFIPIKLYLQKQVAGQQVCALNLRTFYLRKESLQFCLQFSLQICALDLRTVFHSLTLYFFKNQVKKELFSLKKWEDIEIISLKKCKRKEKKKHAIKKADKNSS